MIAYIEGTLAKKTTSTVVIGTVAGIGYEVFVPVTVLQQLPPCGSKVLLHTYLQVKEDGVALFGFASEEELQIFKLLITVNGIGPKAALGILSGISVDDLRFAVLAEDTKTISKIPGIGPKRKQELLRQFKSLAAIGQASLPELERLLPKDAAAAVYHHFRQKEEG